jgi:hypothetical protein
MADRPLPAYTGDEPYVFVTYSHRDAKLVYPQIRWLQELGFKVWWDEGISPGSLWRRELAQAIRGCAMLVYFTTPRSVESEHCVREVNFAIDEHRCPVLSVHLEETRLPDELALGLGDRQAILAYGGEPGNYERALAGTVAAQLGGQTLNAPARSPVPGRQLSPLPYWVLWLAGSILIAAVGLAVWATWPLSTVMEPLTSRPLTRFVIEPPAGVALPVMSDHYLAISHAGRIVYFIGERPDGSRAVYSRNLARVDPRLVPGTEDNKNVRLLSLYPSPDDNMLMLGYNDGSVKRVPVAGGQPELVAKDAFEQTNRMHWSRAGFAFRQTEKAIVLMSESGGEPTTLATSGDLWQISFPHFGKDGATLYYAGGDPLDYDIYVTPLDRFAPRKLLENASDPRVTSTGHLLFVRDGAVWAIKLDEGGEPVGLPAVVLRGAQHELAYTAQYAVSVDGTLVFRPALNTRRSTLNWFTRDGEHTPIGDVPLAAYEPRLSPDGSRVTFTSGDDGDLWTLTLATGLPARILSIPAALWTAVWSPDGNRIAYADWTAGRAQIFGVDGMGAGSPEPLAPAEKYRWPTHWTEKGLIVDDCEEQHGPCDVVLLDPGGTDAPEPLVAGPANERAGVLSPDNRYLAYISDASGFSRIRVQPFPSGTPVVEVPIEACQVVRWGRDEDELIGVCEDVFYTIPLAQKASLSVGDPRPLFPLDSSVPREVLGESIFDVAADGERFLIATEAELDSRLVVVMNWLEEVERLVPSP